jgi:hypothetical protein
MSVLMEPLDDARRQLLAIVWLLFAEHHQFPVY